MLIIPQISSWHDLSLRCSTNNIWVSEWPSEGLQFRKWNNTKDPKQSPPLRQVFRMLVVWYDYDLMGPPQRIHQLSSSWWKIDCNVPLLIFVKLLIINLKCSSFFHLQLVHVSFDVFVLVSSIGPCFFWCVFWFPRCLTKEYITSIFWRNVWVEHYFELPSQKTFVRFSPPDLCDKSAQQIPAFPHLISSCRTWRNPDPNTPNFRVLPSNLMDGISRAEPSIQKNNQKSQGFVWSDLKSPTIFLG